MRPAATTSGAGGAGGRVARPRIVTPDPVVAGAAGDNAGERVALLARRSAAEERIAELERELTAEAGDLDLQLPPVPNPAAASSASASASAASAASASASAPPAEALQKPEKVVEVEVKKSGGGCVIS